MDKEVNRNNGKTYIEPIKWCRYIVRVGYIEAALIILAHVIWLLFARNVLTHTPEVYLRDYIIFPAIGFVVLLLSIDFFVRSNRFSLFMKECLSLSISIFFSLYLCLSHDIASVLLGSFILPIFVSTTFSNVKITRSMFWMSILSILLIGVKAYITGKLNSAMFMQLFVACFMFLCSYLLSKVFNPSWI